MSTKTNEQSKSDGLSIEEMCRIVLAAAVKDGIVTFNRKAFISTNRPEDLTAGDLCFTANRLSDAMALSKGAQTVKELDSTGCWNFVDVDGLPEWVNGDFAFTCIAAYVSERARGIVTVPARFADGQFYWADSSGEPIETEYRRVVAWMPIPRFDGEYNGQTYESGHVVKTDLPISSLAN